MSYISSLIIIIIRECKMSRILELHAITQKTKTLIYIISMYHFVTVFIFVNILSKKLTQQALIYNVSTRMPLKVILQVPFVRLKGQRGKDKLWDFDDGADVITNIDNYHPQLQKHTQGCKNSIGEVSGHCNIIKHIQHCYDQPSHVTQRHFRHKVKEEAN